MTSLFWVKGKNDNPELILRVGYYPCRETCRGLYAREWLGGRELLLMAASQPDNWLKSMKQVKIRSKIHDKIAVFRLGKASLFQHALMMARSLLNWPPGATSGSSLMLTNETVTAPLD